MLKIVGVVYFGLIARQFEKHWPVEINKSEVTSDWKVTLANLSLASLLEPLSGICAAMIVRALGGGLIHLPTDGWWYLVSLATVVLVGDLWKYWHHRLTHAVPFLWAMHSFHHSAKTLTFVTGARYFWFDRVFNAAVFPLMAVLFVIPSGMITAIGLIFFLPDSCSHLNIRLPMGRAITWINNPHWHRIHHSMLPEHHDKNFASLLPLWDILFGTACIPQPGEFPPTGISTDESPSLLESFVWPFRRHLRKYLGEASHADDRPDPVPAGHPALR